MTYQDIKNIKVNDVLMNITTREVIVITNTEKDGCFECIFGDKLKGKGTIPMEYLENPSWYSLMKEKNC